MMTDTLPVGGPKPGRSPADPPASLTPPSRLCLKTLDSVKSCCEPNMRSDFNIGVVNILLERYPDNLSLSIPILSSH